MPIPNREDVDYRSYASCRSLDELPFWLRRYASFIAEDNDGMVPVSSAKWGKFCGTVRSDHLELIGWSIGLPNARSERPFNHLAFWREVAAAVLTGAEDKIS
jgi:triacylglycerol lipase